RWARPGRPRRGVTHHVAELILMKSVTILGATGSVGTSTLDLVEREPDRFRVVALTANCDVARLAAAAIRTRAEFAVVADEQCLPELQAALAGT
ncbi:1-deoxy-D-xylulose-5-phosphate reductoisomerase, partial [Methylobacterium goesingense]|nr:1-deoxy-D-xylulose-5-phosphate reductoisomerase [Methylobacterium goesingense]